jgi:hypothetical protein
LGPRARRRLVGAGVGVAVLAAIGAAVLLTRASGHPTPPSATLSAGSSGQNPHLVFGLTRQQVRRQSGPPAATRGNCWLFHPRNGMVGSISMGQAGSIAARSNGALKLCFVDNAFSYAFRRLYLRGRWKWTSWIPNLVIVDAAPVQ